MKLRDFAKNAAAIVALAGLLVIAGCGLKDARSDQLTALKNVRSIAMACLMYASDSNKMPENLALVRSDLPAGVSINDPSDPKGRQYEYHPWPFPPSMNSSLYPLVWQPADTDTQPIAVGYLDGHAEMGTKKSVADQIKAIGGK